MMHLHIASPYQSASMGRMTAPLQALEKLYTLTVGPEPDPNADVNIHMPWHTLYRMEDLGRSKHVMAFTHVNPTDEQALAVACEKADAITAMSYHGRRELIARGVDPKKITVIPSGANGFSFRRRVVGVVAYAQPNGRKREHILMDLAWSFDHHPFHFVLVGQGLGELSAQLENAGVSCQWFEHVDDEALQRIYNSLDLLLVTGYTEGGPLPVLEALGAGVPVVAPRYGYASDLAGAGVMIYDDLEHLIEILEGFIHAPLTNHLLMQAYTWTGYTNAYALLLGRLVGNSCEMVEGMDRYSQLLDIIAEHKPRKIVELGTWSGQRALEMMGEAMKYAPDNKLHYVGYDLFDAQTPGDVRREYSKRAWPAEVVHRRLDAMGIDIELIAGDTNDMLGVPAADFYFIDGGHSEETIAHDWQLVASALPEHGVVVFDDYYIAGGPEGCGANKIIDSLPRDEWIVTFLPKITRTQAGGVDICMVEVRRADIHLHGWIAYAGSATYVYPEPACNVRDLRRADAPPSAIS